MSQQLSSVLTDNLILLNINNNNNKNVLTTAYKEGRKTTTKNSIEFPLLTKQTVSHTLEHKHTMKIVYNITFCNSHTPVRLLVNRKNNILLENSEIYELNCNTIFTGQD